MGDRSDNELCINLKGHKVLFPSIDAVRPLVLGDLVGSGTYGDVYKAVIEGDTHQKAYAVKHYREETKTIMREGLACTSIRELSAVQGLVHPNVLKMEDLFLGEHAAMTRFVNSETEKWIEKGNAPPEGHPLPLNQIYVLAAYEYCPGGDLKKVLQQAKQPHFHDQTKWGIPLADAKFLSFQLLNGLSYLHSLKMSHRDLKPDNIMLDRAGNRSVLKIGDLGLCRELLTYPGELTPTVCTIYYRPLEVLLGRMKFPKGSEAAEEAGDEHGMGPHYGLGVDVWSAGCIIAELILGKPIFKGTQEFEVFTRICKVLGSPTDEEWTNCTKLQHYPFHDIANSHYFRCQDKIQHLNSLLYGKMDLKGLDLLTRMLQYNPHLRITAAEALSHPWFSDLNFSQLDGIGVYNWYLEVIKRRMSPEMFAAVEQHDKGLLVTTELAHIICQAGWDAPLCKRIDRCCREIKSLKDNDGNLLIRIAKGAFFPFPLSSDKDVESLVYPNRNTMGATEGKMSHALKLQLPATSEVHENRILNGADHLDSEMLIPDGKERSKPYMKPAKTMKLSSVATAGRWSRNSCGSQSDVGHRHTDSDAPFLASQVFPAEKPIEISAVIKSKLNNANSESPEIVATKTDVLVGITGLSKHSYEKEMEDSDATLSQQSQPSTRSVRSTTRSQTVISRTQTAKMRKSKKRNA